MPFSELPLSVLFLFFLLLFSLIGLYPAWQRMADRIRQWLKPRDTAQQNAGLSLKRPASIAAKGDVARHLDSYEVMILRRLARAGAKGLSRKQLEAELYLGAGNVKRALQSLHDRGLIGVRVTQLFGLRFSLSEKGLAYAVGQDFIPPLRTQR